MVGWIAKIGALALSTEKDFQRYCKMLLTYIFIYHIYYVYYVTSAETHLRKDRPKEKFTSIEFQTLCEKQQKLRRDINSLKDAEKRKTLKQERNRVQKQIKDLKRKETIDF